jgi:hypothetical protein
MDDEWNYTGGTSDADFESNLSNTAPSEDWFTNTYGANGMDGYNPYPQTQEQYAPFDPTFGLQQNEFQTMAPQGWQQNGSDWGQIDSQLGTNFNSLGQNQGGIDWANLGKSGMDTLAQLFKGGSGGSTSSFLKGLAGLYAAGQEKKSNQYMANQIPQQVNSMRQFAAPYDVASTGAGMMTPGATTMRDAAMQQAALSNQRLQNFRADPNSDAGYKATTSQIENVLARQAALHGNRNNFNATAPALLAAKAAAQMQYDKNYQGDLNSWDARSGANINPAQASGLEALLQGTKYGAQANSPYMDAIGKILNTNSYESNPQIAELLAAIKANKG